MSGIEGNSHNIDLHCHGGAGFYFSDPNPENVLKAIEFHKANGSSTLLTSLVTEEINVLKAQISQLVPFCSDKSIAGIHLEGPYLAKSRCGAHNPRLLKSPTIDEIKSLLDIGQGHISMITIAPELDGALEAIKYLRGQGVIPAIGHSAGNYDDALRAVTAGAQLVTHFSNGMSKLADGEKTFATALLYESDIFLELILDGHHVQDDDVQTIYRHAGDRIILVTDAIAAAGKPDGEYLIGTLEVNVNNGVARLKKSGSLAGSTLTMNEAISNAQDLGFSAEMIHAASSQNAYKLLG